MLQLSSAEMHMEAQESEPHREESSEECVQGETLSEERQPVSGESCLPSPLRPQKICYWGFSKVPSKQRFHSPKKLGNTFIRAMAQPWFKGRPVQAGLSPRKRTRAFPKQRLACNHPLLPLQHRVTGAKQASRRDLW